MATLDMNLILVEILPRLPAKCLIRFKSVSTSFKDAISSRNFSRLYFRHQSRFPDIYDLLILQDGHYIFLHNLIDCNPISIFNSSGTDSLCIAGSSNGLICLYVVGLDIIHSFTVYNPYTNMYTNIPFDVCTRQPGFPIGFAFDHQSFDYKIVAITEFYDVSGIPKPNTLIYSLNTNTWTVLGIGVPMDSMEIRNDGILINGHLLHWIFKNPSKEARIGCFDVCTRNWTGDVPLPQYYYDPNHSPSLLEFGVFDECLFLLFENRVDSSFDVWVMRDYGVQDSWFKFLSIPISDEFAGGVIPIIHLRVSDWVLTKQRQSSRLYWYNKADGVMIETNLNGAPDFGNHQVHTCSRSIVDIPFGRRIGDSYPSWAERLSASSQSPHS